MPLSRVLLYSMKARKKIINIIGDKTAYLIPGTPGIDDIKLCARMGICLYSGNPDNNQRYSLKSEAKKLFKSLDIPHPPGSSEVESETQLLNTLTKLVAYNLDVQKWVFKINDEYGSRGIAYLDVTTIKPI